jgi:hypothetical protein
VTLCHPGRPLPRGFRQSAALTTGLTACAVTLPGQPRFDSSGARINTMPAGGPRTASRPLRTARTDNSPDLTVKTRSQSGPARSTEPDYLRAGIRAEDTAISVPESLGARGAWATRIRQRRPVTGSLPHLARADQSARDGHGRFRARQRRQAARRAGEEYEDRNRCKPQDGSTVLAAAGRSGWSQMWSHSPGFAGVRQDPSVTVRPGRGRG